MTVIAKAQVYLARSIELATANVLNSGGPFGAVVFTMDGLAFDGVNRVTATNDPTAHAEVTAIRAASRPWAAAPRRGDSLLELRTVPHVRRRRHVGSGRAAWFSPRTGTTPRRWASTTPCSTSTSRKASPLP